MRFDKGVVGVVIVVIALFGTIFAGYFLNVDQETVTVTKYDRVTDVSSLFNYTEQPDYIEYNPAKNYTGYQLSDGSSNGVDYTHASGVNQYPMSTTSSSMITVNLSVLNSTTQYNVGGDNRAINVVYSGTPYGLGNTNGMVDHGYGWFSPNLMSADNLINYLSANNLIPNNATTITIHPKNATSQVGFLVSNNLDMNVGYANNTFVQSISGSSINNDYIAYGTGVHEWLPVNYIGNSISYAQYSTITATPQQCYMSYDLGSHLWTLDVNGQSMSDVYGTLAYPKDTRGIISSRTIDGYLTTVHTDEFTMTPFDTLVDVVFSFDPVYNYLKPSDGVAINHNTILTTNWSNGKSIGDMAIVFNNQNAVCSNTLRTNLNDAITVSYNGTDNFISVNGGTAVNIGAWDSFVLHLCPNEGKVYAVPIMQFNSFVDFSTADYRVDIGSMSTTPFTMVKWSGTSSSYRFSVASTLVQMSTKLLMINPYINVTDYFTFSDGYRLDINSFAKYGTSMTINNVTLYGNEHNDPISDTNTVYYNSKTYKLNNIQIEKNTLDGHTYLRFVNDRTSIDLGETVSDVVSMTGVWYFNTILDEGKISESSQYTWDWANALTSTQSIVVFMGLIVVCSLLARKFWTIKILDLAVIVSAIVLLWTVAELI